MRTWSNQGIRFSCDSALDVHVVSRLPVKHFFSSTGNPTGSAKMKAKEKAQQKAKDLAAWRAAKAQAAWLGFDFPFEICDTSNSFRVAAEAISQLGLLQPSDHNKVPKMK